MGQVLRKDDLFFYESNVIKITVFIYTVLMSLNSRAILNIQDLAEAKSASSSNWVKIDGKKFMSIDKTGFTKPKDLDKISV